MDYESLKAQIEKELNDKIGDEVFDLSFSLSQHDGWNTNEKFSRISARVFATTITIIKPASRLDMIKAAMPYFIRKIFPPKTVEVEQIVGLPGLINVTKRKVAALIYHTDEMIEDTEAFTHFVVENGSESLRCVYTDSVFKGF